MKINWKKGLLGIHVVISIIWIISFGIIFYLQHDSLKQEYQIALIKQPHEYENCIDKQARIFKSSEEDAESYCKLLVPDPNIKYRPLIQKVPKEAAITMILYPLTAPIIGVLIALIVIRIKRV